MRIIPAADASRLYLLSQVPTRNKRLQRRVLTHITDRWCRSVARCLMGLSKGKPDIRAVALAMRDDVRKRRRDARDNPQPRLRGCSCGVPSFRSVECPVGGSGIVGPGGMV